MTTKENIKAILNCNFSGFKDEYIETATNRIMEIIDDALAERKTVIVTIYDQFGNSIEGYMDKSRNLIFTCYGIIPITWIERETKKYTIKEHQEREK